MKIVKLKQTAQRVLFLIRNKEEWMLIYFQTQTNDSCRNWKTVLTVPCVSLGDVSSSLSTWRWRMSLAIGSTCCLNIPKPWLTKWKGGRATVRSLLDSWKQNCRDFSVFFFVSKRSLWNSEDQYWLIFCSLRLTFYTRTTENSRRLPWTLLADSGTWFCCHHKKVKQHVGLWLFNGVASHAQRRGVSI